MTKSYQAQKKSPNCLSKKIALFQNSGLISYDQKFLRPDFKKVGFFRFKKHAESFLITNDIGSYSFLSPQQFQSFLNGNISNDDEKKYKELQESGFIRDQLNFDDLISRFALKNGYLGQGTSLHIVVVTLRCDHKCIYCQAGSKSTEEKKYDMDILTARKTVDRIFESPSKNINIEFQGGEPLLNFEAIKEIISYSSEKNKTKKKNLMFLLVSNFHLMTEEKLDFFIKNNVSFCTSLDGPAPIHDVNRITSEKNSHKITTHWIREIKSKISNNKKYKYKVNALTTVSKVSLSFSKEIVDEFISLGFEGIHLRPVNPFGINKNCWQNLNFSAEDFLAFYRKALNYIIELNLNGIKFYERSARIFLQKILDETDPNFLDFRSPCGAGIGQLAYNFNGDVYTCDEGRMLSVNNDESFKVGNVFDNQHSDFINNETTKTLCMASCLSNISSCNDCVYNPYCGVCPIYNYATDNTIFSQMANNERCSMSKGILDFIFEKLKDEKSKGVLLQWLRKDNLTKKKGGAD